MIKSSSIPIGRWENSKNNYNEEMQDSKFRSRNVSDTDTANTMDSAYYSHHDPQMHSINIKSIQYPQYMKKAADTPIVVPPRGQWIPLHQKSKWPNWKNSIKKLQSLKNPENVLIPNQKIKTNWVLPGMTLKRSVTSGFSFNRKKQIAIREDQIDTDSDSDSENSGTLIESTLSLPKQTDSKLRHFRYSNYYMQGDDGNWIFVHQDQTGRIIGQYEIKKSCI